MSDRALRLDGRWFGASLGFAMTADRFVLKKPRRINVTVPEALLTELQATADQEGRSLSSLCCHLMESGLERKKELKRFD